jgi:hypothetical protein
MSGRQFIKFCFIDMPGANFLIPYEHFYKHSLFLILRRFKDFNFFAPLYTSGGRSSKFTPTLPLQKSIFRPG